MLGSLCKRRGAALGAATSPTDARLGLMFEVAHGRGRGESRRSQRRWETALTGTHGFPGGTLGSTSGFGRPSAGRSEADSDAARPADGQTAVNAGALEGSECRDRRRGGAHAAPASSRPAALRQAERCSAGTAIRRPSVGTFDWWSRGAPACGSRRSQRRWETALTGTHGFPGGTLGSTSGFGRPSAGRSEADSDAARPADGQAAVNDGPGAVEKRATIRMRIDVATRPRVDGGRRPPAHCDCAAAATCKAYEKGVGLELRDSEGLMGFAEAAGGWR